MAHWHLPRGYHRFGHLLIIGMLTFGCGGLSVETVRPRVNETDGEYLSRVVQKLSGLHREFAGQCSAGYGNGCYAIGIRLEEAGDGFPLSLEGAARLYRLGCATGHSQSCLSLSRLFKVTGQSSLGIEILRSRCASRDWFACSAAAFQILNAEEALRLHDKACEAGVAKSCFRVGQVARRAGRFVESGLAFRKACNSGSLGACQAYASLQLRDCLVTESPTVPSEQFQRCSKEYSSEPVEWRQWRAGCKQGMHLACALSSRLDFQEARHTEGIQRLDDSCRSGEPIACHMLASLARTGRYVAKDLRRSLRLYSLACHQGSSHGCFYAAMGQWALDGDTMRKRSIEVINKMCTERRHEPSCRWLTSNCVQPGDCR